MSEENTREPWAYSGTALASASHGRVNVRADAELSIGGAREYARRILCAADAAEMQWLRTPELEAVLSMVQATGKSAHPAQGETVSETVSMVALLVGCSSVALQSQVQRWADAQDRQRR